MSKYEQYQQASNDLAESLLRDLRSKRISKIGSDDVRCAVTGFNTCLTQSNRPMTNEQFEFMEMLVLREIVTKAC